MIDDSLPHNYYGIDIPIEFVKKYLDETIEDNSMKPLLFEWIEHNNFCKEKDY